MTEGTFELVLAGVGGQGIIFAGQIIMESALQKGFKVYGFEEHGMARRGGAVATHIRFGRKLFTPLVPKGQGRLLAAFEPAEALRHLHFMDSGAKVILNTNPVIPVVVSSGSGSYPPLVEIMTAISKRSSDIFGFDATSMARTAGNPITMNVIMLGAICASKMLPLPKEVMLDVVKGRSPSYSLDMNIKAFSMGFDAQNELK